MPQPHIPIDGLFEGSTACPTADCLLGVRPGMPLNDALDLLSHHDWVVGVTLPNTFVAQTEVYWRWSGRQPAFIEASVPGELSARSDTDDTGHYVTDMSIATRLRFYDLYHTLGKTSTGGAWFWQGQDRVTYHVSYYVDSTNMRTTLRMELDCPARLIRYFWNDHTQIIQNQGPPLPDYVPPETLPGLCRNQPSTR
ncbi:MAG: hypothetical protein CL610_22990 [Anaerolineaceae bacterium]|nr:hypothetical protein [Anaerolineaceae bacterium]